MTKARNKDGQLSPSASLFRVSGFGHSFGFLVSDFGFLTTHFPLDEHHLVSILFGMNDEGKQIFILGDRPYQLVEVSGPIRRESRTFPAQFDHDAGVLKISSLIPLEQRAWVVAVAVSDACFRLWRPIPIVWPNERLSHPHASSRPRPGPEGDRPHR